jgi:membrane-bound lytic murein transglycosylase B
MIKKLLLFLVLSNTAMANYDQHEVNNFIDFMNSKHSYSKEHLKLLFNEIKVEPRIKKYFKKAPERTLMWNGCKAEDKKCTNYKKLFVTKKNIDKGIIFWNQNKKSLLEAEKKFGVPPEIIIAIIGIESKYGSRTGTFKTFDTLASLSLGPNKGRRAKFYRDELINFLLMCRENKLDPRNIKGSYAGALGKPQFISSSYRHYAIDFNGDNVVDLWNSNEDVIGSVANYFKKNGWKSNQLIMSNLIYEDSNKKYIENESKKTYKPKTPYKTFMSNKLYADETIADSTLLSVIGREEQKGRIYSFAHKNFYVITRYNRSRLYALAVYSLSNQIKRHKSELENHNL